eukprot:TRINITY_DN863_c0_g1_i2.p1 TRINITY_DN863_c0_g1~~TRINITY_DN863_c0_g1_i2.p1  ORF type:complete len:214 (+),score=43.10 TRINITY_DN863_c0_g1_i2:335-976(+)
MSWNGGKDATVVLHVVRLSIHIYMNKLHLQEENHNHNNNNNNNNVNTNEHFQQILAITFIEKDLFDEAIDFTNEIVNKYNLKMIVLNGENGIKDGLIEFYEYTNNNIKSIFLGSRSCDPNIKNIYFTPSDSDKGWPEFMRVNPIIDWDYKNIWSFLCNCNISYCSLYDKGYTSIGSKLNTVKNKSLLQNDGTYLPAYKLNDFNSERSNRIEKN